MSSQPSYTIAERDRLEAFSLGRSVHIRAGEYGNQLMISLSVEAAAHLWAELSRELDHHLLPVSHEAPRVQMDLNDEVISIDPSKMTAVELAS